MAPYLSSLVTMALTLTAQTHAQEQEEPEAYHRFQSRPDLRPPVLNVNISEDSVEPGYIFMAPYRTEPGQNSAIIYDTEGNVVWTSFPQTGGNVVYDFRPCQYNESSHLCMMEGQQNLGYARGFVSILDDTLTQVSQVKAQNGFAALDQHETALGYNNTAVLGMIYNNLPADLSSQNITGGIGWLQDSIIQKLDIENGDLLFEWSAYEHIPLRESIVPPNTTEVVGTGLSSESPWDYFHINSIDENAEGDYIISARHVNALYKLSGEDGSVLWRLGGTDSDFDFNDGLNFSSQHDARWLESNETHDIISLFDNASNGFNRTAEISSGMILSLDHSAQPRPTCSLLSLFRQPSDQPMSDSQANMQVYNHTSWNTSNTFIGWGNIPVVTEHLPSGEIIYQANVEINPFTGMMNYRAYKVPRANLTLSPTDAPALYTYALSTDSGAATMFYMSWNGATEVASYRILARASSCDDQWQEIGIATRQGFETKHRASGYFAYGLVEALDSQGRALRNSTLKGVRTFVPSEALRNSGACDEEKCGNAEEYEVIGGESGEQQAFVDIAQTVEACSVTPAMLEEERNVVKELRMQREEEDQEEESRAVVSTWSWVLVSVAALLGAWVVI